MAQLSDDCFAFSGPLLPVDELERLIAERVSPVSEIEHVPMGAAQGRVLAEDLVAAINVPPFDNSAVDGYAVRFADLSLQGETILPVAARIMAGGAGAPALAAGQAARIFTGAPMPEGADTVFMQEDTQLQPDGRVVLPAGLKRGANRRFAGEDIATGGVALRLGCRLRAPQLALAAALGASELAVRRAVKVALFSTGNEVIASGALPPAHVYDSNRPLLSALLRSFGASVGDLGIIPDEPRALETALREAARDHDLIITSGGVSTGEADHVRTAVEAVGTLVFWRVAIKPGRPVAMGVIPGADGQSAAFLGLPGNPVAVFVTFVRVVRPLLLRLAGAAPEPLLAIPVTVDFSYRKKKGRREYVRVSITRDGSGRLHASKHPRDGAGIITSLTETDGLGELGDDVTTVEPGATISFLPYASLLG